jgi:uncharacterized membrane protein YgcG
MLVSREAGVYFHEGHDTRSASKCINNTVCVFVIKIVYRSWDYVRVFNSLTLTRSTRLLRSRHRNRNRNRKNNGCSSCRSIRGSGCGGGGGGGSRGGGGGAIN